MEGGYGFKLNHIFMGNGKKTCRFIQMSNAFRIFLLLEICCTHGNQVWKGNDPALALPDVTDMVIGDNCSELSTFQDKIALDIA